MIQHHDIDVNVRNNAGRTPLHYAVILRDPVVTNILLQHPDIDINARDQQSETPIQKGLLDFYRPAQIDIMKLLLEYPKVTIDLNGNDIQQIRVILQEHLQQLPTCASQFYIRLPYVQMLERLDEIPTKQRQLRYQYLFQNH
jgi:ankyrin repeat protein